MKSTDGPVDSESMDSAFGEKERQRERERERERDRERGNREKMGRKRKGEQGRETGIVDRSIQDQRRVL